GARSRTRAGDSSAAAAAPRRSHRGRAGGTSWFPFAEVARAQGVVKAAALGEELGVRAELGDAAALDDDDQVGVEGGGQAVGDEERGPAAPPVGQGCP